jgi:predicted outer membrane repeat protein
MVNFKKIILCCLLLSATIATNAATLVVLNGDNSSTGSLRDIIGRGVYFLNNAYLTNCTFSGNTSVCSGGGINAENNVELNGCSFINNKTGKLGGGGGGGGVWAQNGSANSTDCLFSGNEATGLTKNNNWDNYAMNHGGGLSANVGNLNNCIFSKNRAQGNGGGAISSKVQCLRKIQPAGV